ncbi:Ribosomal RNA small subunit methyltransferase B [Rhynchospora pubera]|uniref:Ribosomal RNA small subunit methyltransferase B n=1 Tax=Rhynchospora pubera TaxID=906938 RepID=A0AAV8H168_9POAL|nr:Ribosomal RNA small subunit methyltransferase B [Rhynchospora pubera]
MEGVLSLLPRSHTQFVISRSNFSNAIKSDSLAISGVVSASSVSAPHNSRRRYTESIETNHAPRLSSLTKRTMQNINEEISPHRAVATVRLLRIEKGGAFAGLLNEKGKNSGKNEMDYVERTLGFRTRELDDRDIRLVTEIVGGTVRWRRYLDHLILSLCNKERVFTDMEPLLLQILRIGFFEIVKLNMPSYAVVDENVKLAKVALRPGAGNLVNDILRKLVLLKESDSLPLPKLEGDDRARARALATIYSHPVWMVRRWIKYLGQEEAVRLMNWNNADPYFGIRVNTWKGYTRADIFSQLEDLKVDYETSFLDDFFRIRTGMQAIMHAGLLEKGICSVQDESAGFVVSVVDPQPGETITDCCAAPGGKSLYMASRLRGQGMVYAIDINEGRLRILRDAAKLQDLVGVITAIHSDLRAYSIRNIVKSDKVLLDVPCSGLGVLSKRADLRWNRHLEDLKELTRLQDELLDAAALLVKPGGVLVYSTCSIDPDENEGRVMSFLQRHPEFSVQPINRLVPPDFISEDGFYFSNPVKHCMDGAFAARLVRSLS